MEQITASSNVGKKVSMIRPAWKYPWHLDQFFVPGAKQGDMRRCYKSRIKYHGGAYKARAAVHDGVKGVMVWRIA